MEAIEIRAALRPRARHAWLLLLPALALLVAFTHWPALATVWHSFLSTPKKGRPARLHRPRQLRAMVEDEVFWQALTNNLIFAVGTIPLSIALAIAMALWVNGRIAGRGFLRLAYFTPTVLPMIAVANIWLFFYTPQYGLLEQVTQRARLAEPQLARRQAHRARRDDRRRGLEGGRLLHDLLPRRAAADPALARRGGGARGRVALRSTSAASCFRCSCRRRCSCWSTRSSTRCGWSTTSSS